MSRARLLVGSDTFSDVQGKIAAIGITQAISTISRAESGYITPRGLWAALPRKAPVLFADNSSSWRTPRHDLYGSRGDDGDGNGHGKNKSSDGAAGDHGAGGSGSRARRGPPPLPPRPPTPVIDFTPPFSGSGWMVVPPDDAAAAAAAKARAAAAAARAAAAREEAARRAAEEEAARRAAEAEAERIAAEAEAARRAAEEEAARLAALDAPSPRADVPSWRRKYVWSEPEAIVEVASAGGVWMSFETVGETSPRVLRRRVPPPRPPPPDDDGPTTKDERRLLLAARRSQALRPLRQQRGELRWRKTPNLPARPLRCW